MKPKDKSATASDGKSLLPGGTVPLGGSSRSMRPGAHVLGVADADEWIEGTVKVRRKQELPEPAVGQAKPGSGPSKGMSFAELEAQYGADPADMEKVKTVLEGQGLRILKEDALSCSIRVGGGASIMEAVFQVKLFHYAHPEGNYRGRKGTVHIPAELDGIVTGVFGLDNRRVAKRRPLKKRTTSLELSQR